MGKQRLQDTMYQRAIGMHWPAPQAKQGPIATMRQELETYGIGSTEMWIWEIEGRRVHVNGTQDLALQVAGAARATYGYSTFPEHAFAACSAALYDHPVDGRASLLARAFSSIAGWPLGCPLVCGALPAYSPRLHRSGMYRVSRN